MTIALSVIVRPSRRLRRLHGLLCVLVLAGAGLVGQHLLQGLMVAAVVAAAWRQRRPANGVRLDISGVGALRLAVYQSHAADNARADAAPGHEVWLMPGSTLWPGLLLLRLRDGQGAVCWLAVLPDSVAPDAMRRLALAMRAIAARALAP